MDVSAGLLPDDEIATVRESAALDRMMAVGDGINGAPALAARAWPPQRQSRRVRMDSLG